MEFVVLVDENDKEVGVMEKMLAHQEGVLHRAFSVFIFNSQNQLLLQQRAGGKYHSPLLWTNTCCSHPRLGETVLQAAERRLHEEMRMVCPLMHKMTFTYKAVLDQGLIEHEYDHVFVGTTDAEPDPNPDEVAAWRYITMAELEHEMATNSDQYTAWFTICYNKYFKSIFSEVSS